MVLNNGVNAFQEFHDFFKEISMSTLIFALSGRSMVKYVIVSLLIQLFGSSKTILSS